MRFKITLHIVLLLIIAFSILLAACTGNMDEGPGTTDQNNQEQVQNDETSKEPQDVAQDEDNVEAAWRALAGDGAVLVMRHAIAPGSGDPPGFQLDDCSTQRNLSDEGRAQAAAVGVLLRAKDVQITKVMSSPWCRAIDTARSMDFTEIEVTNALWNLFYDPTDREEKVEEARDLIRNWRGPGVLLLVTHGEMLKAVTDASSYPPAGWSFVVQPDPETPLGLRFIGQIPPPDSIK
ncbi:histidine phosphatase family protein [Paenibacillus tarimensis]